MIVKNFIRQEDFVSAKLEIRLRNMVSGTVVEKDNKELELLEVIPSGMILSVPRNTCTLKHSLELEISLQNLTKFPFELRVISKVIEVELTSEFQDRVVVELQGVSEVDWKNFCDLFISRQYKIDEFLKNVKGY